MTEGNPEQKKDPVGSVVISASVDLKLITQTHKCILDDQRFFQSMATGQHEARYARIAGLLTALHVESVSNVLFEEAFADDDNLKQLSEYDVLDSVDCRRDLPNPLRRIRAAYEKLTGTKLAIPCEGIQDIFIVRNRILAHPCGITTQSRTVSNTAGTHWVRSDRDIKYKKLRADFPVSYEQWTRKDAEELSNVAAEFLGALRTELRTKGVEESTSAAAWSD